METNKKTKMNTLELKLSLIEQLTKIDDEKLLKRIKNMISKATQEQPKRYPAQMTLDELKGVLEKSKEESRLGLGMTTEELRKRHPICRKE